MMLSAPFAGMKGTKVDGSWSGFADDLFIKDEVPDHTAESAKDIIMDNAGSLDAALAEDKYKQNLRKLEIVPRIRRYGEQRRLTALVPLWKGPGQSAGTLEADTPFNGSNKSEIECRLQANGGELGCSEGLLVCHDHHGATDA